MSKSCREIFANNNIPLDVSLTGTSYDTLELCSANCTDNPCIETQPSFETGVTYNVMLSFGATTSKDNLQCYYEKNPETGISSWTINSGSIVKYNDIYKVYINKHSTQSTVVNIEFLDGVIISCNGIMTISGFYEEGATQEGTNPMAGREAKLTRRVDYSMSATLNSTSDVSYFYADIGAKTLNITFRPFDVNKDNISVSNRWFAGIGYEECVDYQEQETGECCYNDPETGECLWPCTDFVCTATLTADAEGYVTDTRKQWLVDYMSPNSDVSAKNGNCITAGGITQGFESGTGFSVLAKSCSASGDVRSLNLTSQVSTCNEFYQRSDGSFACCSGTPSYCTYDNSYAHSYTYDGSDYENVVCDISSCNAASGCSVHSEQVNSAWVEGLPQNECGVWTPPIYSSVEELADVTPEDKLAYSSGTNSIITTMNSTMNCSYS